MKKRKSVIAAVMGAVVMATYFNAYGAWGREDVFIDYMVSPKGIVQSAPEASFSGMYLGT